MIYVDEKNGSSEKVHHLPEILYLGPGVMMVVVGPRIIYFFKIISGYFVKPGDL